MSSEYSGPLPEPGSNKRRPSSELWGPWEIAEEDTQPLVNAPGQQAAISSPDNSQGAGTVKQTDVNPQFTHREHVTGSLPAHPAEAPLFRPAYSPYPPQANLQPGQAYPPQPQGYTQRPIYQEYPYPPAYGAYPRYAYAPYVWQAPGPKEDSYRMAMAIISVIGSSLVLLVGLGFIFLFLLVAAIPTSSLGGSQQFTGTIALLVFIVVGILGGVFGLYHSIRSLMNKPSAAFSLPWFWLFLVDYLAVVIIGWVLHAHGQEVAFPALTIFLIFLAGASPALAVLALAVRRLRTRAIKPQKTVWPTSWRRFTLALTSGATLSTGLAFVLELVLAIMLALLLHIQGMQNLTVGNGTPDMQNLRNPAIYGFVLLILAVVAPLVEETVKPLAVVLLIGRIRSAAEAFVLGMACGIGFDLVETTFYISLGYHDWLNVALERTGAGLLHGFGAGMVALGWYYLTHTKKHDGRPQGSPPHLTLLPPLQALGCWSYAVLQHAIWNGTFGLILLPAPVGPFIQNWMLNLGFVSLPLYILINIVETLFILAFFIYLTGKLKPSAPSPSPAPPSEERNIQKLPVGAAAGW